MAPICWRTAVLLGAGALAGSAGAQTPRAGPMVLSAGDLPTVLGAWQRVDGRVVDNASYGRAHKVTLSNVVDAGRLTGYQEAFLVHPESLSSGGKRKLLLPHLDEVFSGIDLYQSAAAAETAFVNRSSSFRAVPTSIRIGSQTALYKGMLPSPYTGVALGRQDAWVVDWRDGAVIATVGVAGPFPAAKDAFDLARADEKRIVAQVTGVVSPEVFGRFRIYADPRIVDPWGITAGPDGALWFTNSGSNSIGRISTDGRLSIYTDRSINKPQGIAAGADGALWFTNSGNDSIGRISTDGQVSTFTDPSISEPYGIAAGPDGALWFTNFSGLSIGRITTDGTISSHADGSAWLAQAIAAGPDGALWFAERGGIGRITTNGSVRTFSGPKTNPGGIAAGPDSALWFFGFDGIGRITTSGAIRTITDLSASGMVAGPDGALWFTEGGAIGRMTTQGRVQTIAAPILPQTRQITVGPDRALWFTARGAIRRISAK